METIHIVVAPDSFKESVNAIKSAEAIALGLEKAYQSSQKKLKISKVPLADGGEGTMEVLATTLAAQQQAVMVMGPLQENRIAHYSYSEQHRLAIVEVATACGLDLVPYKQRNPLVTTTFGVGELVRAAIEKGAKKILFALGGSSTNDGGIGMLAALGTKFYNYNGECFTPYCGADLGMIAKIDLQPTYALLQGIELEVACDVENPLIGPKGATFTFGPQKGATAKSLQILEGYMQVYSEKLADASQRMIATTPKTGAAGGIGAALFALGARMQSGISLLLELLEFEKTVATADYVITGEGSIDAQTVDGKTISGVAAMAKKHDVPVIAVAGRVGDGIEPLYDIGVTAVFGIVDRAKSLETALLDGETSLVKTSENIGRLLQIMK
ncbi:MAG: glycerate kinase family protein [Culicoidibacterales bacterium]